MRNLFIAKEGLFLDHGAATLNITASTEFFTASETVFDAIVCIAPMLATEVFVHVF